MRRAQRESSNGSDTAPVAVGTSRLGCVRNSRKRIFGLTVAIHAISGFASISKSRSALAGGRG
ncbi:MAG: hypothetical protein L6Q31_11040 [Fimbriimonadaceae bacterium]|nr:hypothetical protein [Fimbriimonadaceae bacterium]NUM39235.1 hypothetical protein [Armatimonadota bacterium]